MTTVGKPAADVQPPSPSFRLKGSLFPLTQLELAHFDYATFEQDLKNKVAEAPAFFQQTPVVLSLENLEGLEASEEQTETLDPIPLDDICKLCREYGLIPIALRGGSDALQQQSLSLGLALMPAHRSKGRPGKEASDNQQSGVSLVDGSAANEAAAIKEPAHTESEAAPEQKGTPEQTCLPLDNATPDAEVISTAEATNSQPASQPSTQPPVHSGSKVITTPIRSGQQVYAQGGDLIVMAQVSAGAEILADGNIHVYGPLRGRALAGVKGDTSARVFCHSLEAELISIAGTFKLDEDLRDGHWKQPAQIHLDDQDLCIESLMSGPHR